MYCDLQQNERLILVHTKRTREIISETNSSVNNDFTHSAPTSSLLEFPSNTSVNYINSASRTNNIGTTRRRKQETSNTRSENVPEESSTRFVLRNAKTYREPKNFGKECGDAQLPGFMSDTLLLESLGDTLLPGSLGDTVDNKFNHQQLVIYFTNKSCINEGELWIEITYARYINNNHHTIRGQKLYLNDSNNCTVSILIFDWSIIKCITIFLKHRAYTSSFTFTNYFGKKMENKYVTEYPTNNHTYFCDITLLTGQMGPFYIQIGDHQRSPKTCDYDIFEGIWEKLSCCFYTPSPLTDRIGTPGTINGENETEKLSRKNK